MTPMDDPLIENSGRYQFMINLLPVGVMVLSDDGSILAMNPAALASIEAASLDQVRNKSFLLIVAPEFRSSFHALVQKVLEGGIISLEYQITGLQGTRRWLETDAVPLPDPEGGKNALLAVIRDTTERFQREGRNRYFQKMEAIATLTGGIAHDFNNVLTSIVGYANILKLKLPRDDPRHDFALQILSATERAAAITKNLLSFGSKQILSLKPVRLFDMIQGALEAARDEIDERVSVTVSNDAAGNVTVMIDKAQMEQALRHIILNARDALPEGGAISITTALAEIEDTFISIHGYGTKGAYAVVAVTDTGTGMDEETVRKAFEPFFTTKETGKGLGLGLAIVYGTVKSHKGFVNIYSEPGTGTVVRVYLPAADPDLTRDIGEAEALPEGKGETVLIVDDDDHGRNITTSVLRQFGYVLLEAASGDEAIRTFREHADRISLVMLDVILPVRSGKDVCDAILHHRPDMKVLFTSGYTTDLLEKRGLLRPGIPFLPKPVSPRKLLQKIREVLQS
jgi:PAS domain S-box-containing protein